VQGAGCSFAYVPDALDDARAEVLALADGCDLLVRGAPFLAAEAERARAFGHATVERALADARDARVRRVVLTHHAPSRTDDELDAIARCLGAQIAREGLEIAL
jgi:ribonuclease BN (tRNA processing enzyme)